MKLLPLLPIVALFSSQLSAQTTFEKNDIYLEAGGNGLLGSVNYERQVTEKPGLGFRFGFGFYVEQAFYVTVPIGLNYLFPLKNNRSFIEAGLGLTFATFDRRTFDYDHYYGENNSANFVPSVGYRRHTKHSVMWRVSATPIINRYATTPWIGASIGKRF